MIKNRIIDMKSNNKNVLIPYIMAGDGGFEETRKLLDLVENSNAAAVEIGIPFSDPSSDGEVIQEAGKRALEGGTNIYNVIEFLKSYKSNNKVPKIVMTYFNPVLKYGISKFFKDLKDANVKGIIIPDLPVEEYDHIYDLALSNNVEIISLITTNTMLSRLRYIEENTTGFLYLITVNGTTGIRDSFEEKTLDKIKSMKETAKLPVVCGFGISNSSQVEKMNQIADGAIMGSMIVKLANENKYELITELLSI